MAELGNGAAVRPVNETGPADVSEPANGVVEPRKNIANEASALSDPGKGNTHDLRSSGEMRRH